MTNKNSQKMIELTADEREGLERVASSEPPYSQRAQGLIAMADGANLAEAGMASGLTIHQMRYWLGRFGTRRLSIFPDELLLEETGEKEVESPPPMLDAPEEAPLLQAPGEAPLLSTPELAGELPEMTPDNAAAAVGAAGGAMAVKAEKSKKSKKNKKSKKDKKSKKSKKKDKKGKKSKKNKKKKDKKSKKNKNKKKN